VQIDAGAILGGSGSVAGTVTSLGGIISAGNSPGTLTLGGLILDSLSSLKFDLDTPGVIGSGVNDLINVNGDLGLAGTLNVNPLGGFGAGVYRLLNYTGALTDGGLTVAGLPTNLSGVIDTSVLGQVNLTVTAVPEPSTVLLFGLGGVGLIASQWRRRARNQA